MIYEKGNEILNSLERRFGGLALPMVLRWIASFQVLTWALSLISPDFLNWLAFDRDAILSGEVWRVVSWIFYPRIPFHGLTGMLFVLIALLFMFFISDSIESHWKAFRLNVYVFSSILLLTIVGFLPGSGAFGGMMTGVLYSAVFLAFATLFPNQVIHLFGIIPIKAKWLGVANAALLTASILGSYSPILAGIFAIAGLLPYFLAFGPGFVTSMQQRSESAVRRHKFQGATTQEGDAFHECESCGATEISHPNLSFRVSAEGDEFCENCRPPVSETTGSTSD